mmetsp:Transcript_73049/g.116135  ORF Transcript_73049/g.116135 Transcript_73049/m.116135 type:complete len:81 (-) Transcript_73049:586-828(-)
MILQTPQEEAREHSQLRFLVATMQRKTSIHRTNHGKSAFWTHRENQRKTLQWNQFHHSPWEDVEAANKRHLRLLVLIIFW